MSFPVVICDIISEYSAEYKLLDWIDESKLHWYSLLNNKNAISIIEKKQDQINWNRLSENPSAIHLIKANQDRIKWDVYNISQYIMKNNMTHCSLSQNPSIFELTINKEIYDILLSISH